MTLLVLLIIFKISCPSAVAQDLSTTLRQMHDRYANSERLHLMMDIRAYPSDSATTPFFQQSAEVQQEGDNYRCRYQDREVLLNERVSLVVDRQHRLITCQARDRVAEAAVTALPFGNLDSLLALYGSPVLVGQTQKVAHYEIHREQQDIERIGVWINTRDLLLQKLQYHYRNGSKVVIAFTTLRVNPRFDADTFSEESFITRQRDVWQPTEAYAHYQLAQ